MESKAVQFVVVSLALAIVALRGIVWTTKQVLAMAIELRQAGMQLADQWPAEKV